MVFKDGFVDDDATKLLVNKSVPPVVKLINVLGELFVKVISLTVLVIFISEPAIKDFKAKLGWRKQANRKLNCQNYKLGLFDLDKELFYYIKWPSWLDLSLLGIAYINESQKLSNLIWSLHFTHEIF